MTNELKKWALAAVALITGLQMASTAIGMPIDIIQGKLWEFLAGTALIWLGILASPLSIRKTL